MSVIIRLQNLPMSANASNIRRFFAGLSIPEGGVHIVGGSDGDAFIAFATDEDARKAMLLDRQTINNAPVRLFLSSKTEMQSIIDSARSSALFGIPVTSAPHITPQKSETMQALDVTAPTLPSSFPSYRNGVPGDSFPGAPPASILFNRSDRSSPNDASDPSKFDLPRRDAYSEGRPEFRASDQLQPQVPFREHEYDRPPLPFTRPDDMPDRSTYLDRGLEPPGYSSSRVQANYRQPNDEPVYDRTASDSSNKWIDSRLPHPDSHSSRPSSERYSTYNKDRPSRFQSYDPPTARDPRGTREQPRSFVNDRRAAPEVPYDRGPYTHPEPQERDFSVRPPWLNDDTITGGPKRPFSGDVDPVEYPRKRRTPTTQAPGRPMEADSYGETDWVIRLTLPISDTVIKSIFEILRGVHVVTKWGIRIEEDALQRPTGHVFIMTTGRDSFERALTYNGRQLRGKAVQVVPSSLDEFYKVSDSTFRLKCPPEIAKKLPAKDAPLSPPHHADGCLEVAELPPDTTKSEIVRFLGAPGLSESDVVIAGFSPTDKALPETRGSVRALVSLPSSKDITILLSAKPRPLRPDGAFPPVRLTPISRMQFDAYAAFSVDKSPAPPPRVKSPLPDIPKTVTGEPLTCAFLSGLNRVSNESEILRLFPSVLIPGDAIRLIGPSNTTAFIEFIGESNCRRAVADITGPNSKAKRSHPNIRIEPIARSEMEHRLAKSKVTSNSVVTPSAEHRPNTRLSRDRDPRDLARPPWESQPSSYRGARREAVPASFPSSHAQPSISSNVRTFPDQPFPPFDDQHHVEAFNGIPGRARLPLEASMPNSNDRMPPTHRAPESIPPPRHVPEFATVHIANLPPSVTVDQLSVMLRDYYFVPGSIRLRRDIQGMPTGEGLVDFNSCYDGDRAIRDLNGYRLGGRPLALRYDRRP